MAKRRRGKKDGNEFPGGLSTETLKKYAMAGAQATLAKLREEIRMLERFFPALSAAPRRKGRRAKEESGGAVEGAPTKRRTMSRAARAKIAAAQKARWAKLRKTQKRGGKAGQEAGKG